ncbi:hypothetical protein L3X38_005892 [Prunus dulcis]|uniref:Uncharacterized protein n=1 Tax=Prunus dulcis TaxID=3755 RepID=A0AAD5F4N0_PRUDU|nr:hypothetical protein L3X38_005892 [Prunus dulcis]
MLLSFPSTKPTQNLIPEKRVKFSGGAPFWAYGLAFSSDSDGQIHQVSRFSPTSGTTCAGSLLPLAIPECRRCLSMEALTTGNQLHYKNLQKALHFSTLQLVDDDGSGGRGGEVCSARRLTIKVLFSSIIHEEALKTKYDYN